MKIYEKIVIDMSSGETLSEISYNYEGSLALCGSGGGGGSSGKVSYAQFMEDRLEIMLDACIIDMDTARAGNSPYFAAVAHDPSASLAAMETSVGAFNTLVDALAHESDWAAAVAQAKTTIDAFYDPTTQLAAMDTAICVFDAVVDALNYTNDWDAAMDQAKATIDALIDDTYINADVAAYADTLDDQVDNITIPKFQRGMQDINAVQSSAFALGEALIYGMRDRDVAKFLSELRMKLNLQRNELITGSAAEMVKSLLQRVEFEKAVVENTILYNSTHIKTELSINEMFLRGASQMLQNYMQRVDFEKMVLHYSMEYNRMYIAASKDEDDRNIQLDELDARWDLDMYQYGANVLASIGSGVAVSSSGNRPSQAQSAIGGALSGAAAGAMMTPANPLMGAGIGGALGLASSFL